jgi:hypothetical protein
LLRGDRHESHRFLRVFGSHEVGELEARDPPRTQASV